MSMGDFYSYSIAVYPPQCSIIPAVRGPFISGRTASIAVILTNHSFMQWTMRPDMSLLYILPADWADCIIIGRFHFTGPPLRRYAHLADRRRSPRNKGLVNPIFPAALTGIWQHFPLWWRRRWVAQPAGFPFHAIMALTVLARLFLAGIYPVSVLFPGHVPSFLLRVRGICRMAVPL